MRKFNSEVIEQVYLEMLDYRHELIANADEDNEIEEIDKTFFSSLMYLDMFDSDPVSATMFDSYLLVHGTNRQKESLEFVKNQLMDRGIKNVGSAIKERHTVRQACPTCEHFSGSDRLYRKGMKVSCENCGEEYNNLSDKWQALEETLEASGVFSYTVRPSFKVGKWSASVRGYDVDENPVSIYITDSPFSETGFRWSAGNEDDEYDAEYFLYEDMTLEEVSRKLWEHRYSKN